MIIREASPTPTARSPAVQKADTTLVLGLGNILLTDEGTGVHVVTRLAETHAGREDVEFMDGGTLSFSLAGAIVATDSLIVVDTAALGAAPGAIRVFEGDAMDQFVTTGPRSSVHEVSLSDLLAVTALEGLLPRRRALVGIQPQDMDWGDRPTNAVAQAIPAACEAVMDIVNRWQS
ncbi:Hydrogenase maturation protease [Thioalkalivibrio nitratireducens DSM 14787]|uniref:Hydrogenase maturation protease n=1 Tax=Thioalkalivibrio nitratireducens (strain DSM 14787 / UNIQEM 213 / ALEN2) TaxID=1255043 RepID=L0DXH9_THIND|nr:HyaD/HybD family hydrogenase maturation endopeptidase [Thioalkalivibrio nitratireducens]AGA33712.1 Hydrogenase maturation protease [Thioalkalivibrio nitratireducens DSM 14787]